MAIRGIPIVWVPEIEVAIDWSKRRFSMTLDEAKAIREALNGDMVALDAESAHYPVTVKHDQGDARD